MRIGEQIRAARLAAGMTRKQLAEKMGMHEANLGRLERGTHGVSESTLRAICDALKLEVKLVPRGPAKAQRDKEQQQRKAS